MTRREQIARILAEHYFELLEMTIRAGSTWAQLCKFWSVNMRMVQDAYDKADEILAVACSPVDNNEIDTVCDILNARDWYIDAPDVVTDLSEAVDDLLKRRATT